MTKTIGRLTSEPDEKGRHKLKCPSCKTTFLYVVTKDEKTDEVNPVVCTNCSYSDKPIAFLHELNNTKEEKMVKDFAEGEIKKRFKNFK